MIGYKRHYSTGIDGLPICGIASVPRKNRPAFIGTTSTNSKVTCANCKRVLIARKVSPV